MRANYAEFNSPQFRVLSDKQITELHFASLQILENTGVAIYADEALALLDTMQSAIRGLSIEKVLPF